MTDSKVELRFNMAFCSLTINLSCPKITAEGVKKGEKS